MILQHLSTRNWNVVYDPDVGTLHVYNDLINKKSKDELDIQRFPEFTAIYDIHSHNLILFQMNQAYSVFGDIDKMSKRNIIQRVKGYNNNYGRR